MLNKETYESASVINHYTKARSLQLPEKTILSSLSGKIKNWNILDIGIGGGRTTANILPMAKTYTGIDISNGMVEICKKIFGNNSNATFLVVDARDLSTFQDSSFDFVLFSFNGIDCVPFEDRRKIFLEIRRVLKKDGVFCFSSHNTRNVAKLYSFHFAKNPIYFIYQIKRFFDIRRINGGLDKYINKEWFCIKDGAEYFKTDVVYIQPELQLELLKEYDFSNVQLYSSDTGLEMKTSDIEKYTGGWVYYLCK